MSNDIAQNLINERRIMSIQYFIFEDSDDDQPFVFEPPENNPLDMDDPEVGLSQYYGKVLERTIQ